METVGAEGNLGASLGNGPKFSVSEFLDVVNQTLAYAYGSVLIEGEVASYKVNQGKWVFFDLKDEESSVGCFMPLYQLRMPLEDGMKIVIRGEPRVTKWGKFSVTVRQMMPVGEGNIKKSFEILKKKLAREGLFDAAKKRGIPENLKKIGVISSVQAAGYADFCKILNARWGGMEVLTAHTQVQGMDAADQIIRALKYFNEKAEVDVIAIVRGGGSADDLAVFNDEQLVRAIAASRIPVITGIGHEIDESLADLAADAVGSTPSNVAEMLTPDKVALRKRIQTGLLGVDAKIKQEIERARTEAVRAVSDVKRATLLKIQSATDEIANRIRVLEGMDPEKVLKRGYAIISGKIEEENVVKITTFLEEAEAKIVKVKRKEQK